MAGFRVAKCRFPGSLSKRGETMAKRSSSDRAWRQEAEKDFDELVETFGLPDEPPAKRRKEKYNSRKVLKVFEASLPGLMQTMDVMTERRQIGRAHV